MVDILKLEVSEISFSENEENLLFVLKRSETNCTKNSVKFWMKESVEEAKARLKGERVKG